MEYEKITVTVLNKGFIKDEIIGTYTFDLTQIYFANENHAIEHQWVGINNPSSDKFTEITGCMRLSIAVQAEGDKKYNLALPDETKMDLSK